MTVSIFNPEHDLALADGTANYTPPKAARQLRKDLEWISSLWTEEGEVTVWGWDKAIVSELRRKGVPASQLPTDEQLDAIRTLSNRSLAVELLAELTDIEGTVGRSRVCQTYEEVLAFVKEDNVRQPFAKASNGIIVKAPWSSSGRGVKHFRIAPDGAEEGKAFVINTIAKQGTIVAEMECDKVRDFALEYDVDKQGTVSYAGLSLFHTTGGAYKGNLLLPEEEKRAMLREYVTDELMQTVSQRIKAFLAPRLKGVYCGPIGVDMMICRGDGGYMLNPCVEINLRRTMGHVALALTKQGHRGSMVVEYDGTKYELKVKS